MGQAQQAKEDETKLLVRAIEQFLETGWLNPMFNERPQRECEELALMNFDDVGSEAEWLVVQNEALAQTEANLE